MNKLILLGANWCPITKETKKLFEEFKQARPNFNYQYIDISSEPGKELVEKFSVTDVPKTIFNNRIIFHGLPQKAALINKLKKDEA